MISNLSKLNKILLSKQIFGLGSRTFCTRYTKSHEWITLENNKGKMGITDYAQRTLGDIVFVEPPRVNKEFSAGDPIGVIESVKAAADVYAPIKMKITEINQDLEGEPEIINEDAEGEGWIVEFESNDTNSFKQLLTKSQYQELIKD